MNVKLKDDDIRCMENGMHWVGINDAYLFKNEHIVISGVTTL